MDWINLLGVILAETEQGGITGWVTAGTTLTLLGPVLYWLMYVHLPAKDKQIADFHATKDKQLNDLLEASAKERDLDRQSRHDMATTFQKAITEGHNAAEAEIERQRVNHEADRKAGELEFKEAMKAIIQHCKEENERLAETFKTEIARVTKVKNTQISP